MKRFLALFMVLVFCVGCWFTVAYAINRIVPNSRYVRQVDSVTLVVDCDSMAGRNLKSRTATSNDYYLFFKNVEVDTSGYVLKFKYLMNDSTYGYIAGSYGGNIDSVFSVDSLICKSHLMHSPDSSFVLKLTVPTLMPNQWTSIPKLYVKGRINKTIVAADSLFKVKVGVK